MSPLHGLILFQLLTLVVLWAEIRRSRRQATQLTCSLAEMVANLSRAEKAEHLALQLLLGRAISKKESASATRTPNHSGPAGST